MDQYELYLQYSDFKILFARRDELSPSLKSALSIAKFDFEQADFCRIYPDISAMVEIARVLDYIPRHYHKPLADALRADGWNQYGRVERPNTASSPTAEDGGGLCPDR